jgi:S-adenosylmethionine-diacylglycerol 3-amino-3-carboxypropyl transferase
LRQASLTARGAADNDVTFPTSSRTPHHEARMTAALAPSRDPKPQHLLRNHVHHSRALSRKGMMERLFTLWFSGFVYNQIWEDPRVDLEALQLDGDSRVLTISSGGCNVLNYLTAQPAAIVAVDLNRHHIYLARLKLAAAVHLPGHEDFFRFFGCADDQANLDRYYTHIQPHLDPASRHYWEGTPKIRVPFRGPRIRYFTRNFYNYSKLGLLLRFTHLMSRVTRRQPHLLLQARSLDDQRRYFEDKLAPFFEHPLIRSIGRFPLIGFSLGIPPAQLEHLRGDGGNIIDIYGERVRRLACDFPIEDNYFAWQAFSRSYDTAARRAIPDYLKADHFDTIRACANRVQTHVVSMTDYLRQQEPGAINRFVFLDAQDWLSREQITELWTQVARVSPKGGRIIFRTAGTRSPIETALPSNLRGRFEYEHVRSSELHGRDRSAVYGGFHLYIKTQ